MPSVSKAQQRFMGLVHAYKKGEVPANKVSQAVKDAAKSMKKKSTKKFASTKHKGLPNKVRSENMNEDGHTDVASAERKLKLIMKDAMDTLNALKNLSNEDSLPSWWTDKITLAKDYVGKSRDYIMNPAESVDEFVNEKMGPKELHAYMQHVFDTQFKTPEEKKMKKTLIKKMNVAQKKKGLPLFKESVNEDITSAGYYFLRKAAYGIGIALRDLNSGIKRQNDKIVLNEIDYIYDKVIDMKRMMKNKKYNESVNEVSGVDVAKKVLKNKQYEKGIDLQTANLIVTIDKAYDKNPKLQKKFRALQLPKMKQLILKYYG